MVYNKKLISVIKVNGKVLREDGDTVKLPFGSEYSIFLKNLNSTRASVKVNIDGIDVLGGSSLVVNPNSEWDLKGFINEFGVMTNKFKFIEKTEQISNHRGDRIDDGFIRIEFAFEKVASYYHPPVYRNVYHHHNVYHSFNSGSGDSIPKSVYTSSSGNDFNSSLRSISPQNQVVENVIVNHANDEGITVKGSEINSSLSFTTMGELESPEVTIIRLKGISNNGNIVKQAITVDTKIICPTCGTSSKSNVKFCSTCGTMLR